MKQILRSAGIAAAMGAWLLTAAAAKANTYTVTSTTDGGIGSLRAAISAANANPGADFIGFAIGSGAKTITLAAPLPDITDAVIVDGSTQAGFGGAPLIRIDGVNLPANSSCLRIYAPSSTVQNLALTRCPGTGLVLGGGSGHQIYGNYFGTDGNVALGNGVGMDIYGGSSGNFIGGSAANQRNVISGNGVGIVIFDGSTDDTIANNFIGTNASGDAAVPNDYAGLRLFGDTTTVGGSGASLRNVISGNTRFGIVLESTADASKVQGNYIGLNAAGTAALGNLEIGVRVYGASNSEIGGATASTINVISGNGNGVVVDGGASATTVRGNRIGTNPAGTVAMGNINYGIRILQAASSVIGKALSGNLISGNLQMGVAVEAQASATQILSNRIGTDVAGGVGLGNGGDGVSVAGIGTTIGGLGAGNTISGNGGNGIIVYGSAAGATILNNRVGTTLDGLSAVGNSGYALRLLGGSNVVIGDVNAGNVFSGNGRGVILEGGLGGVKFKGNIVGLKADQSAPLPNHEYGLAIATAVNQIGGTASGESNIIAGNDLEGIALFEGAVANHIEGNYIGTNASLAPNLGNGYAAIELYRAHDNVIGGTSANAGNVITGSYAHGVYHQVGFDNAMLGNRIFGNGRSDIELEPIGPEINDPLDADAGVNLGQNYPVLTLATAGGGNLSLSGSLNSAANSSYRIEYFHSAQCHPSGFGGGEEFVGFTTVATDAAGNASINDVLMGGPATGVITATATDGSGNTSAFSPCVAIGAASAGALNIWRDPVLAYEDQGKVVVAVTRSLGFAGSVSVNLVTANGTATAPSDFTAQNQLVTFGPGEVVKQVTIPLVLDNVTEGNEDFVIALQNPTGGATLGSNASVQALLFDHDPANPFISVADVNVTEPVNGSVQAVFHVTNSGSDHAVSLSYYTFDGTALAGSDYVAKTGTLDFAPGETDKTVSVSVLADAAPEGDESFFLHVTGDPNQGFVADDLDGEAIIHNTGGTDLIFADGFQSP